MKNSNNELIESIILECENDKQVRALTSLFIFKAGINEDEKDKFLIAGFGQGCEAINRTAMRHWVRGQLETIDQGDFSRKEIAEMLNNRFNDTLEQFRG